MQFGGVSLYSIEVVMCRYKPSRSPGYAQGAQARRSGVPMDKNPHLSGTRLHEAWKIGWSQQNGSMGRLTAPSPSKEKAA